MQDGPIRRVLKWAALANFLLNLALSRVWRRRWGRDWELTGTCGGCARCCEAPALRATWPVWHLPWLRWLVLFWQRHVNGFRLVRRQREGRVLVFECSHFDLATRRCDSYDTRPGICRDYPRALLAQPSPEFLPGCGYRAVPPNADGLLSALERAPMRPEQREHVIAGLRLRR